MKKRIYPVREGATLYEPNPFQSNLIIPVGSEIIATEPGRVVSVNFTPDLERITDEEAHSLANVVEIDEGKRWSALYVHVQPTIEIGQRVKRGDVLGISYGSIHGENHMHFLLNHPQYGSGSRPGRFSGYVKARK